jgi:hypothetical protein
MGTQPHAGIGAILMDERGKIVGRISQAIGDQDSFSALKHDQPQLRVYCDNYGLTQLWCEQRNDSRLVEMRRLAAFFVRFSLHPIPRQHNQLAHRLVIAATRSTTTVHVGTGYQSTRKN